LHGITCVVTGDAQKSDSTTEMETDNDGGAVAAAPGALSRDENVKCS